MKNKTIGDLIFPQLPELKKEFKYALDGWRITIEYIEYESNNTIYIHKRKMGEFGEYKYEFGSIAYNENTEIEDLIKTIKSSKYKTVIKVINPFKDGE